MDIAGISIKIQSLIRAFTLSFSTGDKKIYKNKIEVKELIFQNFQINFEGLQVSDTKKIQKAVTESIVPKILESTHDKFLKSTSSQTVTSSWIVDFFHYISESVIGYKIFLKEHKIDPGLIKSVNDIDRLPITSRVNYLKKYSFAELLPLGDLKQVTSITASTGSNEVISYFPLIEEYENEENKIPSSYLKKYFFVNNKPTLVVLCMPLGVWRAGTSLYNVFRNLAASNNNISVISPGVNIGTVTSILKDISQYYNQVILVGITPFLLDVLNKCNIEKINLMSFDIKILLLDGSISEFVRRKLKALANISETSNSIMTIYGTGVFDVIAFETPISVLIRNMGLDKLKIFDEFLRDRGNIPNLFQYQPNQVYLEHNDDGLVISGIGGSFPLLRYQLPERGVVIQFDEMRERLFENGIDIIEESRKRNIQLEEIPFVFIEPAQNFPIRFHDVIIYPEYIMKVFKGEDIKNYLTGKFKLKVISDDKMNDIISIDLQLNKGVESTVELALKVKKVIHRTLVEESEDYRNLCKIKGNNFITVKLLSNF